MRISAEHLKHWLDHGYAIVNDVLTPEELAAAQRELYSTFPSLEEYTYAPSLYRSSYRGGHMKELPFLGDVLNFVAVQPEIVSFVERALETKKIALAQSLVWAKYPGADDFNLALHMDYRTTMLVYPRKRRPFEDIIFIIYYVDVDEQLGATSVVSKQHYKDELLVPDIRPESEYPELYQRELPVHVRAGSMLIYSNATIHRASGITSKDRIRFSHHIVYQSDDAPWKGYCVWAQHGLSPELQHFMEQATTRQRELFGFPPLGHEYWDEDMLVGVAARYPNMDMMPYLEAADIPEEQRGWLRGRLRQPRVNNTRLSTTDYLGHQSAKEAERPAADPIYDYYRGLADYYAAVSGVAADYWLTWLLANSDLGTRR
jgi:ectoine hydroxylase-related dioxygenase (phytanoyl-CoA dioxygenase family)